MPDEYALIGPKHDLDEDGDCWCQPETIPVPREDGSIGYVYVHRSGAGPCPPMKPTQPHPDDDLF